MLGMPCKTVAKVWSKAAEQHMPSPSLTRPIKPKGHPPLHTVDQVCAYMIGLPLRLATMPAWERAASLAGKARDNPSLEARAELTQQVALALFVTHSLDVG
jgi:hypothetical protein